MKTQSNRPITQADCDYANTLRDYERAHKTWMNTSVFTEAGQQARYDLLCARDAYLKAVKIARPSWIVC